jgi:hypothetical protein
VEVDEERLDQPEFGFVQLLNKVLPHDRMLDEQFIHRLRFPAVAAAVDQMYQSRGASTTAPA